MASFTINFEPALKRHCGDCRLCCTLVPVEQLHKPANTRCQHQFSGGCRIYAQRPGSCRMWNCAWLTDPTTADLHRPDRAHYVIDTVPDTVVAENDGERHVVDVYQVWIDPAHPDAHRDPALRAWLAAMGTPALVRNGNTSAVFIAPPSRAGGEWLEQESQMQEKGSLDK